jgi:GTP cyclohydrolase I
MSIAAPQTGIVDIQSHTDHRLLAIQKVGVKSLRHPIQIVTADGNAQSTIATFDMFVNLAADQRGTHMSRFVELLHSTNKPFSITLFNTLLQEMTHKLQAQCGYINMQFPFFMLKSAPISKAKSYVDYEVTLKGEWLSESAKTEIKVVVPVTSLCPCSKAISEYGAHNQRSHITVTVELLADLPIESLITLIEKQASCELFGILKRADEKHVTEKAYENPKFVEDLVRDIASELKKDARIKCFLVESENFESIHNHSAYAALRS